MGRKATNEVERFWSKVAKGGEDECWEFLSKPQPSRRMDYRTFQKTQISGQRQGIAYAHRYMFELIYGTIPRDPNKRLVVRHTCDNPPCVNPKHLILGTYAENTRDSIERGRWAIGAKNPCAKLTEEQVRQIRISYANGERQVAMAKKYGVTQAAISLICVGKNWSRLK